LNGAPAVFPQLSPRTFSTHVVARVVPETSQIEPELHANAPPAPMQNLLPSPILVLLSTLAVVIQILFAAVCVDVEFPAVLHVSVDRHVSAAPVPRQRLRVPFVAAPCARTFVLVTQMLSVAVAVAVAFPAVLQVSVVRHVSAAPLPMHNVAMDPATERWAMTLVLVIQILLAEVWVVADVPALLQVSVVRHLSVAPVAMHKSAVAVADAPLARS